MEEEDRLSNLPDAIICEILLVLPIEDAVRTCILSTRWKDKWRQIPSLTFSDDKYSENEATYQLFDNFVSRALSLRIASPDPLKMFTLKCHSSMLDSLAVQRWVRQAINGGQVEEVCLSLPRTVGVSFNIFASPNLVSLALFGFRVVGIDYAILPSLKSLVMISLCLPDKPFVRDILSQCRSLEFLKINTLDFVEPYPEGRMPVYFEVPNLVTADVISTAIVLRRFFNVEYLRTDVVKSHRITGLYFCNLRDLVLHLYSVELWDWVVEVLCHCPFLENLVVKKCEPHLGFEGGWLHRNIVPECMISKLETLCLLSYTGKDYEYQFAKFVMQYGEVLREARIRCKSSSTTEERLEMLTALAFFPRTCQLIFE